MHPDYISRQAIGEYGPGDPNSFYDSKRAYESRKVAYVDTEHKSCC